MSIFRGVNVHLQRRECPSSEARMSIPRAFPRAPRHVDAVVAVVVIVDVIVAVVVVVIVEVGATRRRHCDEG